MTQFEKIKVEEPSPGIARISLNSPHNGNSQNPKMIYELDTALMAAARDSRIKVIILAGDGKHFSAGHDLRMEGLEKVGVETPLTSTWDEVGMDTIGGWYAWEHEMYLDMCRRWRTIAKPTIAQVQGACIAGGLMLAWVCDLIVASENAFFQDPVVDFGIAGVEYFAHVWEIGPRRAKAKLFTADRWTAQEAYEWGMVSKVVADDALPSETLTLAESIAKRPSFALKLVKELVNGCVDQQGLARSLEHAFALHHVGHAHNRLMYGTLIDPNGIPQSVRRTLPGGSIPKVTARHVDVE